MVEINLRMIKELQLRLPQAVQQTAQDRVVVFLFFLLPYRRVAGSMVSEE